MFDFEALKNTTNGAREIGIGLIDGPIKVDHPSLEHDNLILLDRGLSGDCSLSKSQACGHGTFIAGILKGKREDVPSALSPGCTLVVRSIFSETVTQAGGVPSASPQELARAIVDLVDARVNVLNLSLGLVNHSSRQEPALEAALNYAAENGVIVVAAAGNQGTIGSTAITRHPWVIPVVACDVYGKPLRESNLGKSIGRNGLRAPGMNIVSIGTALGAVSLTGTSVAVPFVTGTIALLWSLYPNLSGRQIKWAITGLVNRRSIVPPVLQPNVALAQLRSLK